MTTYELSKDAEDDLREMARYTLDTWGREQLAEYRQGLKEIFNASGRLVRISFVKSREIWRVMAIYIETYPSEATLSY